VLRAQGNGNTSALDSDESDASVFGLRRAQRETEDCDELSEPPSQGEDESASEEAELVTLAGCVKTCDTILVGNASVFVFILNCSKCNGNASW